MPLTAKKLLSDNLLGEVVDVEFRFECYVVVSNKERWKGTDEASVGLVYDLGSHLMNMTADVFGTSDGLYADVRYQHGGAASDDNFCIALYYVDGKEVTLTANKYAREPSSSMTLHDKHGSYVKQNADNQEALLLGDAQPVGVWNREPGDEWGILHTEVDRVIVRKETEGVNGNYAAFYENLYDTLQDESSVTVQPRQVTEVLRLLEKMYESVKSGYRVKVQGD